MTPLMSCTNDERRNDSFTYCRNLLNHFVSNASRFYEGPFVVYNVHSVKHIPDDVEYHNVPLHKLDAFAFENKLKSLKQMIRGPHNPIAQIYRKNDEKHGQPKGKFTLKVSLRTKDYCFETDTKVLLLKAINGERCRCHAYLKSMLQDVFLEPEPSSSFGIYYIPRRTKYSVVNIMRSQLVYKCVNLPFKEGIAVIPMVDL